MAAYSNANQPAEGAEFFSARLNEFGPRLSDSQRALYLSAIGLLRAQYASSVSLLHRIGHVKDSVAMVDQAKRLSGGQVFVVNWISGLVRAQLPGFLHQRQTAQDDLTWCAANTPKHQTSAGCGKWIFIWESSPSLMATRLKRKIISARAATKFR